MKEKKTNKNEGINMYFALPESICVHVCASLECNEYEKKQEKNYLCTLSCV